MPTDVGTYRIRSAARGPHWIAWVAEGPTDSPVQSVVHVGQTREEAERGATAWAEQHAPGSGGS